jgi:hypothetical protein
VLPAGFDGDQWFLPERIGEISVAAELAVEVTRKRIAGNEDVRFAA